MTPELDFKSKKHNYAATHVKVFVHGYLSATDIYNKAKLIKYIPDTNDSEDAVFTFWDSGSMPDMLQSSVKAAVDNFSISKLGLAKSLFKTATASLDHFNQKKDNTIKLGQVFFQELNKFLSQYKALKTVTLYGHSLGARLLIEALLNYKTECSVRIENLVLLGGARDLSDDELDIVIQPIHGRVYNFHSSSDRVLKFKPSLEKCIGRHAIDTQKYPEKVYNAHIDIGHTDYWDNLRTVFNYVKNEGERYITPADMQHKHLLADLLLYQVVVFSESDDLLILSRILSTKKSSNIQKGCFDASAIAHEIQLMGGHSIANRTRGGKGVSYAEIVEDVASKLNLTKGLGQQTTLEKEQAVYQEVLKALKSYGAVSDANLANDEFFVQCFTDDNYVNSIETLHKILNDMPIDPAGPAYSVTIPIVAVICFLRSKLEWVIDA